MEFRLIDLKRWKRKAYFTHYFESVPCTYSMTVKLDITTIKTGKAKLYPTLLYAVSTVVNRHEEFRMAVDDDQPLRLCKHCQKVFLGSRSNAAFCSPRCKNQYNVYKSRSKKGGNEEE